MKILIPVELNGGGNLSPQLHHFCRNMTDAILLEPML